MSERLGQCRGLTATGDRCKQRAGASGFCHLHDPEKEKERQVEQELLAEAFRLELERDEIIKGSRPGKLELVQQIIRDLEAKLEESIQAQKSHRVLQSVTHGLYIEIEKLTKKAPAETITDLALEQINNVIEDTKTLMQGDAYIQKLKVFVPAGDMPELRDALLVLSQIKQGLERFASGSDKIRDQIQDAKIMQIAFRHLTNDKTPSYILREVEQELGYSKYNNILARQWKTVGIGDNGYSEVDVFNVSFLDSINLNEFFDVL